MEMSEMSGSGAVYVQTNEPTNRVIAFRRAADGSLAKIGAYETGGAGDAKPHLTSQGSVVLSADGTTLLVANAASDDVTVFSVAMDGALSLAGKTPVGAAPKSITERDGIVYVLNTGKPSVNGFRIGAAGLEPIVGTDRSLSAANADPAQVGITPDGRALVVTERGTDSITAFPITGDGALGEPRTIASSGPTPYGFSFTAQGTLIVTEAFRAEKGAAAASTYRVDGATITPATASVGNGRSEICWAVTSKDGRYVFTTNFADGAVSRYAVAADGTLTLEDATAGITVDGRPGLRDEDLTSDGMFLYAIDADAGAIVGWRVEGNGTLSRATSVDGLPATIAGLAAR